ncbi:hypothetical protein MMC25_006816 [Agyrium rufum]|nr:hypothetical protein [Agyrium rufum]
MYFSISQTEAYLHALLAPEFSTARPTLILFFIPSFLSIPYAHSILHGRTSPSSPIPQDQVKKDTKVSSLFSSTSTSKTTTSKASNPTKPKTKETPSAILLGAQNCAPTPSYGPLTGETSPADLSTLGISIIELGHAERRAAPFSETPELIARKAVAVVSQGMIPLVCIGEKTRGGRGTPIVSAAVGMAVEECWGQVRGVMEVLPRGAPVVFAYEPVWAIGAVEPAGRDHVCAVVQALRGKVEGMEGRGSKVGVFDIEMEGGLGRGAEREKREEGQVEGEVGDVRFLYGGSAGPGIWEGLKDAVDGLFLGRFAHDIDNLSKVLEEVEKGDRDS